MSFARLVCPVFLRRPSELRCLGDACRSALCSNQSDRLLVLLRPCQRIVFLPQPDQVFQLPHEFVDILKGTINRGKAHVRHLIN